MDKPAEKLSVVLGDAIQAGMDYAGSLPAKEAVKVRPQDWHRIVDLGQEAAQLLRTLSADNARLREERDEALENGKAVRGLLEYAEDNIAKLERKWKFQLDRADAAEDRLSEAVEVLKPFAAFDTGPIEDDEFFHLPDTHPLLGEGLGGEWHSVVTIGDFRRARQFLDTQGGRNG
jgi:hypothetical protein